VLAVSFGTLSCKRSLDALDNDNGDNGTNSAFDRVTGLPEDSDIETITFTPVKALIKKLKLGGASGPDGIAARLLT